MLRVLQFTHELIHGAGTAGITNRDAGFPDVRQSALHVRAGDRIDLVSVEATTQRRFGGTELAEQRLTLAWHGSRFTGIHHGFSDKG